MKTVNIAPTWRWVARVYVAMKREGNRKVARAFRKELERLGRRMAVALHRGENDEIIRLARAADEGVGDT